MPLRWRGFDLRQIEDPALRSQLKQLDVLLKQLNATVTLITGSTTTSVSTLAAHASTHLPAGSDPLTVAAPASVGTANSAGTAESFARSDHVHDASALLPLDGTRDMTGELGTDVGTFRSDVASGGTGFDFNTANSFTSGKLWRLRENAGSPSIHEITFEGHTAYGIASSTSVFMNIGRTLTDDTRTTMLGQQLAVSVEGTIGGLLYSPTITGALFQAGITATTIDTTLTTGSRTVRGGVFQAVLSSDAGSDATQANCKAYGGQFSVSESVALNDGWGEAYGCSVTMSGSFSNGLTNAYGVNVASLPAGTNRWSFKGSNKVQCDASDFIAAASGKGYIDKDSQSSSAGGGGTARYWRMYVDASATGVAGDVTLAIDSAGTVTATRAGGATGTVLLKLVDVGTAAPTT